MDHWYWITSLLAAVMVVGLAVAVTFTLRRILFSLKEHSDERRKLQAFQETVLKSAPVSVQVFDTHGRVTYVNEAFLRMWGYPLEEHVIWRNMLRDREVPQEIREAAKEALEGKTVDIPLTRSLVDRSRVLWWTAKLIPVPDEAGQVGYVICTHSDLTGVVQAQGRQRESEQRYRAIADNAPLGILMLDEDLRVLASNPRAREWFPDLSQDGHCYDAINLNGGEGPCAECVALRALRSKGMARVIREVESSGQRRYWRFRAVYIPGGPEGTPFVVELIEDETERYRMEAQLRTAQKMEAVASLAGGLAHDFNNILSVISSEAFLLMARAGDHPVLKEGLMQIEDASQRAGALTRQLLSLGRRQSLQLKHVNLNRVITDFVKLLGKAVGEEVRLEVDLDLNLWTIHADVGQLEQVIMNLCVNARDAMPQGGRVMLRTRSADLGEEALRGKARGRPGRYVVLSVSDTGVGMDAPTMERIFDPFYSTKGSGTGLGLAVVHGIVEQHQGFIDIRSALGKGTTFDLYIPESLSEHLAEVERVREEVRGGTETVLVVEDNHRLRELSVLVLQHAGYRVLCARDCREALELAIRQLDPVELVLLDMILPDGSVVALYEALMALPHKPRVLLTSGHDPYAGEGKPLRSKGLPFLAKPFTPPQLLATARDILDRQAPP